jgi:hypothetical protein
MRDGWWINYNTGVSALITEHERDIRETRIAKRLCVPIEVFRGFADYTPVTDRIRFLTDVMKQVPLMRVRGHGAYASFEYCSPDGDEKPFEAIGRWVKRNAGPALLLNIVNLATKTNLQVMAGDWADRGNMDSTQ